MDILALILVLVLITLIIVFFFKLSKEKDAIDSGISKKYGIKTRNDAWNMINNPLVPDEDRKKIEELYQANKF